MKSVILLILSTALFAAPSSEFSLSDITSALAGGDVDKLSQYFDTDVEITILNQGNTYSKDKASTVLKDFFSHYPPQSFTQMHQGKSKGQDSQFCIGNLVTTGSVFRVYIYLKVEGSQNLIKELRFNKE